jgi:hypothetical protein
MRIAWWIRKATNTHSQYVIIIASLQHQLSLAPSQFHVISTLAVFWGNEQENILARLFPAGATLLQTYAFNRTATGIGILFIEFFPLLQKLQLNVYITLYCTN